MVCMQKRNDSTIKAIETSTCKLELKYENIVFLYTKENASIEIPEVNELHKAFREITDEQPCYLLVMPGIGTNSSSEARKYAANNKNNNIVAEAIIVPNLAIHLLANFYIQVNRPTHKVKIFKGQEKAIEWLMKIREETKSSQNTQDLPQK